MLPEPLANMSCEPPTLQVTRLPFLVSAEAIAQQGLNEAKKPQKMSRKKQTNPKHAILELPK